MTHGDDKAKWRWWRPRFSLRALAIVVTLICLYFASWPLTKRYGMPDRTAGTAVDASGDIKIYNVGSPLPFVIRQDEVVIAPLTAAAFMARAQSGQRPQHNCVRRYYAWFLGYKIKLPYESTLESPWAKPIAGPLPESYPFRTFDFSR